MHTEEGHRQLSASSMINPLSPDRRGRERGEEEEEEKKLKHVGITQLHHSPQLQIQDLPGWVCAPLGGIDLSNPVQGLSGD